MIEDDDRKVMLNSNAKYLCYLFDYLRIKLI